MSVQQLWLSNPKMVIEAGIIVIVFFFLLFLMWLGLRRLESLFLPPEIRKQIEDIANQSVAGSSFYGKGFKESDLDKNANRDDLPHDGNVS